MRCLNIRNLGQGKPGENDKKIGVGRSSRLEARYSQIIEHILMGGGGGGGIVKGKMTCGIRG